MTKVTPKAVEITPELAQKYLNNNTKNRPLVSNTVSKYSRDMRENKWHFNGEPIIIADDGTLLDGQHRLAAIVSSKTTHSMIVIKGVDKSAFTTIDIGKKRTAADAIATHNPDLRRKHLSHNETINFLDSNRKKFMQAVDFCLPLSGAKKIVPMSCMVALFFLFSQKDPDAAVDFFNKLNTGENLYKFDPVLLVRNRLIDIRHAGGVFRSRELIPYLVKAWEISRRGERVEKLRLNPDYIPQII